MSRTVVQAEPEPISIDVDRTALVIIDMQRDFLLPGGFGESLGNDVSRLTAAVRPCAWLLEVARARRMLVIHTREGHRPDLADLPDEQEERVLGILEEYLAELESGGRPSPEDWIAQHPEKPDHRRDNCPDRCPRSGGTQRMGRPDGFASRRGRRVERGRQDRARAEAAT